MRPQTRFLFSKTRQPNFSPDPYLTLPHSSRFRRFCHFPSKSRFSSLSLSLSSHSQNFQRLSTVFLSPTLSKLSEETLNNNTHNTLLLSLSLSLSLVENSLFHCMICGFSYFISRFVRQPNKIYSSIGEPNTQNSRQFQKKVAKDRANVCFLVSSSSSSS
jgi:hypothetical protein